MKKLLLLLIFLFLGHTAFCSEGPDSLLVKLNAALDHKKDYDEVKLKRIDSLKKLLNRSGDIGRRYELNLALYNEYKAFNYATAFSYSQKLQQLGRSMRDPVKIAYAKLKLGFIMLSSGLFKETVDSLRTIDIRILPDSMKREYYQELTRTFYDLSDFVRDDYFSPIYEHRADEYIDSAIALCQPNTFEYLYYTGMKYLKTANYAKAITALRGAITQHRITDHQFAVSASTLSDVYTATGRPDSSIILSMQAAIADVRSSTKEEVALVKLAQLLHNKRDNKNAYVFIKQGMADAIYYGARQRQIQVSAVLPVIAGETINSVEEQRRILFLYSGALTLLALMVVAFAVIIYKQLRKIKIADAAIIDANQNLQLTINKLDEANTIKDEYIGYYFNLISEYINKLEKFKRSVDNKITTKKFDEIRSLVNDINLNKEREELFVHFDKAFLKIFPNFVESFNALFAEETKVKLQPNQLLNTDLRIFALVRLGITDTEKIANILGYSLNTIYNYRTRIKNRSAVSNDGFEHAIMAIRAI